MSAARCMYGTSPTRPGRPYTSIDNLRFIQ
ncbi:Uncharacterised protein [Mycobacteroides abscessus subsp. abscessus]|nr:Uncharacterised protein [Mycobacteroides abscessus subsp. abscessus]